MAFYKWLFDRLPCCYSASRSFYFPPAFLFVFSVHFSLFWLRDLWRVLCKLFSWKLVSNLGANLAAQHDDPLCKCPLQRWSLALKWDWGKGNTNVDLIPEPCVGANEAKSNVWEEIALQIWIHVVVTLLRSVIHWRLISILCMKSIILW